LTLKSTIVSEFWIIAKSHIRPARVAQFIVLHAWHLDMDVDAVEQ
jgi:hypothetical protein